MEFIAAEYLKGYSKIKHMHMQQLLITTSGDSLMKIFHKVLCLLEIFLQVSGVP